MTMMFVIAATLALSAQHRQRELALMRTVGSTPGQVRRMILGEAVVVAVPAVLVGCVPGLFLGRMLFDQLAEHGVASAVHRVPAGLAAAAGRCWARRCSPRSAPRSSRAARRQDPAGRGAA